MQGDLPGPAARPGRGLGRRGRRRLSGSREEALQLPAAGAGPAAPGAPFDRRYWATTLGIVSLVTLVAFEAMAVSTAMPVVAADLDAVREYGFAFSLFMIANLLGIAVAGGWGDARGPAGPLATGLVLFGVGLVLCGAAQSLAELLVGRALAGAGGGLVVVSMYVCIARAYPTAMRPRVFSYVSAAWVLPAVVGPALAGWLAEDVSWRLVFLLVPPLTVPPALVLLPRARGWARRGGRTTGSDRPAARALAGAGLAGGAVTLLWGLDRFSRPGAGDDGGLLLAGGAVAVALLLVAVTLPRLLPPGTLRLRRGLPTVVLLRGLYTGTFFGAESFVPLMLVTERGLSPTAAGLVLTGAATGWTIGSFLQARPGLRVPRTTLLAIGAVFVGIGLVALTLTVRPPAPAWTAVLAWSFGAFGMGLAMSSTSVLVLSLSTQAEQGRNSAGLQLSDALGAALGIGLSGAAFAAWHEPAGSDADLFAGMWGTAALVAFLAAAVAALRARPAPVAGDPG